MAPRALHNMRVVGLALLCYCIVPAFTSKVSIYHQGLTSGQLYSITNYNQQIWSSDSQVGNVSLGNGPSAVAYQGSTYVFHNTAAGSPELSYWVAETGQDLVVPDTTTSYSPSAVVYSDRLFLFHAGGNESKELWFNVFDGEGWAEDTHLGNGTLSDGPGAVLFNSFIYVFYQLNNKLWYTVFNGDNWLVGKQVPKTKASASPSGVVFNNKLYVFHRGGSNNTGLWYNVFDGTDWDGDKKVPGSTLQDGPTPIVNGNKISVYYKGTDSFLHYNVFDSGNWGGDLRTNITIGSKPAVIVT